MEKTKFLDYIEAYEYNETHYIMSFENYSNIYSDLNRIYTSKSPGTYTKPTIHLSFKEILVNKVLMDHLFKDPLFKDGINIEEYGED